MFSYYEPYQLLHIYNKVITKQAHVDNYPTKHQQFSAENLVAFIELQKNINSTLMELMKVNGLRLTNTDHILKGLYQTCINLGLGPLLQPVHIQNNNDATKRKLSIFHSKRLDRPEVMVTLDINYTEEFITELLKNGMTIARINCAYGTEEEWENLITAIRNAERKVCFKENMACKIYMDLAGPKVRVGPIQKTTYPYKIKVSKDRYGFPLHDQIGLLLTKDEESVRDKSSFDFILPLNKKKVIGPLAIGDILKYKDFQNRIREFPIIDTHPNGYITKIDKTTYIAEGTPFIHDQSGTVFYVGPLKSEPVEMYVKNGDRLIIHLSDSIQGKYNRANKTVEISTTLPKAFENVQIGDEIYIDDGNIQGLVEQINSQSIKVNIIYPNDPKLVKEYKGINLPNTKIELPFLTQKDINDLTFISRHADFVGVSFIDHPDDLAHLQNLFPSTSLNNLTIVAKIETKAAVNNFSKIILRGLHFPKFAVMVARGDLAIEVGFEKLAVIQQEMLAMCQAAHVPIILATQVLDRLAKTGLPSRSELADVFVGSSFDCIMLNKGPYADKALDFLIEILKLINKSHQYEHKHVRRS